MAKEYRIVEEVYSDGVTSFLVESRLKFLGIPGFWCNEYEWSYKPAVNLLIRRTTMKEAELVVAHLKGRKVTSAKTPRLVKTNYHNQD
jgi:hypothetical protein